MARFVGAHVSAAGGVFKAPENASKIGATAFALFVKNQRQWNASPLPERDQQLFKQACEEYGYSSAQILPHDGYLINLGNPDPDNREKSYLSFLDEARRCEQLGLTLLNFHPGSHLREISEDQCLELIAGELNKAILETDSVVFVLENTAGQGSNVGYRFEHLAAILSQIKDPSRIGVCLDSCHTFVAGYDLKDHYDEVLNEFDRIVGLHWLRAWHLNDAKKEMGSKVDRHELLGGGTLGVEFFKKVASDPRFQTIPLILETPDPEKWAEEIALLKTW